jgi:hypothetical protein
VVQVKSITLFRYGFNNALWGQSRNNSGDSKIGCIEQGVELRFRTLTPTGHDHHVQIEDLAKRCGSRFWHDRLNYQHPAVLRHCLATILEDHQRKVVAPIMDDSAQQVGFGFLGDRVEEVSRYVGASLCTADGMLG